MPRTLTALVPIALALGLSLPAVAAPFADVPSDHWAAKAVNELTVVHPLMKPLPDGRFGGNEPFTRYQFAQVLSRLIAELEILAKTSLASPAGVGMRFGDIPGDHAQRDDVHALAERYHLFEGVPGVDPDHFAGDTVVNRYEMATIIDNLMRLAESKDVVRVFERPATGLPFHDISATNWARPVIQSVWGRYRVMVGFPDDTFRGDERLTRYQFAAAAGQTIPLIRELVTRTAAAKAPPSESVTTPLPANTAEAGLLIGILPQTTIGIRATALQAPGPWWVGERIRLLPAAPGSGGFVGELGLAAGYRWPLQPDWELLPGIALSGWGAPGRGGLFPAGLQLHTRWRFRPDWWLDAGISVTQGLWGSSSTLPAMPFGRAVVHYKPTPVLDLGLGLEAWTLPDMATGSLTAIVGPSVTMGGQF